MSLLHAKYCADRAVSRTVAIAEHERLARDIYRIRLPDADLARRATPGQFFMTRFAGAVDPMLGRAFALYDTVLSSSGQPEAIDLVFMNLGKFTAQLARVEVGRKLDVWGPLGNGFLPQPTEHLIMVAGGIGQTPFPALAREYLGLRKYGEPARECPRAEKVTLCYGARTKDYLAGVEDFKKLGVDVRVSTDDGTAGHKGLVTDVLKSVLDETSLVSRVVCCGPEKMMEAVAHFAHERHVPCEVSLETPMACGIGICFSCVAKVRDESGNWDYKRTCVEGPVFDAELIEW